MVIYCVVNCLEDFQNSLHRGRTAATAFYKYIWIQNLVRSPRECMIRAVLFLLECFPAIQFITEPPKIQIGFLQKCKFIISWKKKQLTLRIALFYNFYTSLYTICIFNSNITLACYQQVYLPSQQLLETSCQCRKFQNCAL